MRKWFFTSESVTEGHPDKMCDQISDGILDAIMAKDPYGRVACETTVSTGLVTVVGQITTSCVVNITKIVRKIINDIGYVKDDYGFNGNTCAVLIGLDEQSPDIAGGVNASVESKAGSRDELDQLGAGDQGIMFGFACNETPELMPMPIALAHQLAKKLAVVRKSRELPYLQPDGKTQVTVEYLEDLPARIEAVVIACQHEESVTQEQIRQEIIEKVVKTVLPPEMLDEETQYFINATGRFVIGGPQGDSGLTGKKIIVDTMAVMPGTAGVPFRVKIPLKLIVRQLTPPDT